MNSAAFFAHPMLMYWLPTWTTLPLFSAAAMNASPCSQECVIGFSM